MSDQQSINIGISSSFQSGGVQQATQAAQSLAVQQQRVSEAQAQSSQTAAQAEKDTLRYASAMAQAQRATGDLSGAVETHRTALSQMTPGTIEAHQATTRLAQAEAAAAKETQGLAAEFSSGLKNGIMSIVGPAAIAGAAIAAISKSGELIQLGAQAQQTQQRFEGLAVAAHTTGDALLGAMRSASAGTISDLNLELAANKAQLLGVADSAQEFSTLMEIARDRAQTMGISTTQAFDNLVTGLGRGSPLILDNLGITLSVAEANATYAKQLGKTATALTEAEKKQALINAVLLQGKASLDASGGAAETNASKIERLGAVWDNLKASVGGGLADAVLPTADLMTTAVQAADGSRESLLRYVDAASAYAGANAQVAQINRDVAASIVDLLGIQGQQPAVASAAAGATDQVSAATQVHTQTMADDRAEAVQWQQQYVAVDTAMRDSTLASMADTQAKQALTAQTQLLEAQDNAAVQAFLMLNPNISASGVAAMAAAGQINPLLAQLIQATLRAREAAGALAYFNAMQGLKTINVAANLTGANSARSEVQDFKRSVTADNLAKEQKAYRDNAKAVADAKRDQVLTVGTHNEQIKQRESDLAQAERLYGAQSAQAIRARTALEQEEAQKQRAAGGGRAGGGGGGTARVSEAEKIGTKLADVERNAGQKLAEIEASKQQKLADIDRKAAAERLRAARKLADDIASANADTNVEQQLNDFDKFQKDLTDEQKAAIADREAAEVHYNEKVAAAQAEAQQSAADGDAQLAADILAAKEKQAKTEQEIEEKAAKARREGGKGQAAAVNAEAQEATAAAQRQAGTEIAIAQGKAQERAQAQADEKTQVVAEAEDQKNKVISSAENQLAGVKKASDAQKAAVVANLRAQAEAAERWASDTEAAAARAQEAYGKVTGPTPTPTGGEDQNTGAPPPPANESASQSAMTGSAALRVSGGMTTGFTGSGGLDQATAVIQEASQIIVIIAQTVRTNKSLLSLLNQYAQILSNATTVLTNIADLRARLAMPQPPLDLVAVQQLANEQAAVVDLLARSINPAIFSASKLMEKYKVGATAAIDILNATLGLRESVAKTGGPIDPALIGQLAAEATQVASIVVGQLVKLSDAEVAGLKRYADGSSAAIGILNDVMDLAKAAAEPLPPIPRGTFERLADLAGLATSIILTRLLPTSQSTADALKRYQESAGAAVAILKDMGDLARGAAEPLPPIPVGSFERLADLAGLAVHIIQTRLLPQTDEQAASLKRYQDSAGAAIGVLKDMLDFGQALTQPIPTITPAMMEQLAVTAQQATRVVLGRAIPVTQDQADALKRYSETQGAAVTVLKNTLDLPAKLFTDYTSPSDAQISRVVRDADRVARQINEAAKHYDTKGLEAAKAFSEAIGGTFAAFKEGMIFAQALTSGDFVIDPRNLATFEQGMGRTIAMAGRLGKLSAAIPPANIKSLQDTAAALSASYESMTKLAAVPFGNIPQLTGGLGKAVGGNTTSYFNNTFVLPAGTTQQIAQAVIRIMTQQVTARR